MSRPIEHGDVTAVEIDGEILLHVDGYLHGPTALVDAVYMILDTNVSIGEMSLKKRVATLNTPIGVAVALLGVAPGRARLISAPKEVVLQIANDKGMSPCAGN